MYVYKICTVNTAIVVYIPIVSVFLYIFIEYGKSRASYTSHCTAGWSTDCTKQQCSVSKCVCVCVCVCVHVCVLYEVYMHLFMECIINNRLN